MNIHNRVIIIGFTVFLTLISGSMLFGDEASKKTEILASGVYNPNRPESSNSKMAIKMMRENPSLVIKKWGGIKLPGGAGRTPYMMALAAGNQPHVAYTWFHIIQSDIGNRFLYPLNEWIGDDKNGDGMIDASEAKWKHWNKVKPLWQIVASRDGKIYGIPMAHTLYMGVIYRKDMIREAGLDPETPPSTWAEFHYWCQRLTDPGKQIEGAKLKRGQRGFAVDPYPFVWLPWVQSAGGSLLIQKRTSPTTGKEYSFPMETNRFTAPDTGENLNRVPSIWQANFDSKESVEAAKFIQKLCWGSWLRDPVTKEPVNLTEQNLKDGFVKTGTRRITFKKEDIIIGCVRPMHSSQRGAEGTSIELMQRGEVAMRVWFVESMIGLTRQLGLEPHMIGMFPYPAKDKNHKQVMQKQHHYVAMTERVAKMPKAQRDQVWKFMTGITSQEVRDDGIRGAAFSGMAMLLNPADLKRLGLDDYIDDIPETIRKYYKMIDNGEMFIGTEPFIGKWQGAGDLLSRSVLDPLMTKDGITLDIEKELKAVNDEANKGAMFKRSKKDFEPYKWVARVVFAIVVAIFIVMIIFIIRERAQKKITKQMGAVNIKSGSLIPWLMMFPALGSIALWNYYPLVRGIVMAFQDYKIVGQSEFVGLFNFIDVAVDPNTWIYVSRTLKFAFFSIIFGFSAPILLAILLNEIPRGKIMYRSFFFLPQLTSGVVITLLWMQMYSGNENGIINQIIGLVGFKPVNWLNSEAFAMLCVVLPGVWSGAGMASLIYIAALQSFPKDYYESAAIDGCGFFHRIWHITLPQLFPLIVINGVGAFIGAFQNMGSILLMTFGGPKKETMVLGFAIWKLAYNDLRFSTATTLAWFLGVALIGFTYFQIRFLRKVEFRRAEAN